MNIRFTPKVLQAVRQLRQHEHWTRAHLKAYQAEASHRLREHAYAHSPFYQKFHKGLTDRPLSELPVLTKRLLMENFDEVVTDPAIRLEAVRAFAAENVEDRLYLNRYWVSATSGSSGQPGFFLFDESEFLTLIASFARGQEWTGATINLLQRRKMATVASISPWHLSSQVSTTVRSWWTPSIRIAASEPLARIVQTLNEWQPQLLIVYASMARILAEEQLAGRLHIQPLKTFTSSEVLTDETRRRVKAAWGDEPYNQYGATETADIAAECWQGRKLHLFEDLVLVEVVDEHNRPVPPGTYGAKLLITTFFSRTQPLIRYEINDSVRLSIESCACGRSFAVVESIQGRVEDALRLPSQTGEHVTIQPLVFNRIMDILPVSGWQVIQEADDALTILLSGVRQELVEAALENQLAVAFAAQGVRVPRITVKQVDAIPKSASGKAPLIKARPGGLQNHE
jgi:putative adenylate-forming enzyme